MDEKSTAMLMEVLRSAETSDIEAYEKTYLKGGQTSFVLYMDTLIREKGLKRQDIFQKADLPWKYGYKLLSGESHTTERDKLLRIFIAMGLTLQETQRALALYGMPALYPKVKRDAVVIIAINKGMDAVDSVNELLQEHGEKALARSGN